MQNQQQLLQHHLEQQVAQIKQTLLEIQNTLRRDNKQQCLNDQHPPINTGDHLKRPLFPQDSSPNTPHSSQDKKNDDEEKENESTPTPPPTKKRRCLLLDPPTTTKDTLDLVELVQVKQEQDELNTIKQIQQDHLASGRKRPQLGDPQKELLRKHNYNVSNLQPSKKKLLMMAKKTPSKTIK
jgi:hypothetical protein